ncbi:hypothetical protein PhaeoP18_01488 [Phaeobacter piscinae]|nr:hypothetical protein PhaeoP18_01488 [Phaeobacter piscinae]
MPSIQTVVKLNGVVQEDVVQAIGSEKTVDRVGVVISFVRDDKGHLVSDHEEYVYRVQTGNVRVERVESDQ